MKQLLVTGASGGVGQRLVESASKKGWRVLAAVRNVDRARKIDALGLPNVLCVKGDLATDEGRSSLLNEVSDALGENGLDGFVSCAGAIPSGPVETLPASVFLATLETNIVANLDIIKHIAPALQSVCGRVVLVTALSADFALFPLMGAYAASKRGMDALGITLREELAPLGIRTSVIAPGGIKTDIFDYLPTVIDALRRDARNEETVHRYAPFVQRLSDTLAKFEGSAIAPTVVAEFLLNVLEAKKPKVRYLIGMDARVATVAHRLLPDSVFARMIASIAVPKSA